MTRRQRKYSIQSGKFFNYRDKKNGFLKNERSSNFTDQSGTTKNDLRVSLGAVSSSLMRKEGEKTIKET